VLHVFHTGCSWAQYKLEIANTNTIFYKVVVTSSASIKRVELKLGGFVRPLTTKTTQRLPYTATCSSGFRKGLICMLLPGEMLLSEQAVLDATMLPNNHF